MINETSLLFNSNNTTNALAPSSAVIVVPLSLIMAWEVCFIGAKLLSKDIRKKKSALMATAAHITVMAGTCALGVFGILGAIEAAVSLAFIVCMIALHGVVAAMEAIYAIEPGK